jgi:hypothetical protein
MNQKYLLFVDELQLEILRDRVNELLDAAIAAGAKLHILALTGLLQQLEQPRKVRQHAKGFLAIAKEQLLGSKK